MGQTANTLGFKGHLVSVSTPGTENKRKNNFAIVAERQKAAIDEMEINRCGCVSIKLYLQKQMMNCLWLPRLQLQFNSVQSLSRVQLFETPWIAASQASLSITNSRSLLKLMSIESVMPSSRLILFCPLLLLPPIPPSIRVFSNESTLLMRRL